MALGMMPKCPRASRRNQRSASPEVPPRPISYSHFADRAANVEHFFFEQEPTLAGDALLASLRASFTHLQTL